MPESSANAALAVDIALRDPLALQVALTCQAGHTLALFGASGSGKTTTLRAIAGLCRPSAGRIAVNGVSWFDAARSIDLPTHRRSVGYVFQEYALFPHLPALANVKIAARHLTGAKRTAHAHTLLEKLHLTGLELRLPHELSGGQRQRVAMARALAGAPQVLLLDEPFSAVDAPLRRALYDELLELRRNLLIPIVIVTHDFNEVLRFADTVAVLDRGTIVAYGGVNEIAARADLPQLAAQSNAAAAFDAIVCAHHPERGLIELALAEQRLLVPAINVPTGASVRVRVPARDVVLATQNPAGLSIHNRLAGTVLQISPLEGGTVAVHVGTGGVRVVAHVTRDAVKQLALDIGAPVFALIKSVAVDTMERAVAPVEASRAKPDETVFEERPLPILPPSNGGREAG